jgi:alanyl-tRNA synthetase
VTASEQEDCERWWEIWNLVLMQFNRLADGSLEPLPRPSVDTGMGFERIVSILQGKDSNYDTDLFSPMIERTAELLGASETERAAEYVSYRVIADHSRAMAFLIADGVLPGNIGRNYVLRLILRRAARYGRLLGFKEPFLADIVDVVIENMGGHYEELQERRDFILAAVRQEEERFLQTLDTGLNLFEELAARLEAEGKTVIPGEQAFKLYDTYGFPLDLTRDVAKERGMTVDEAGFHKALEAQRARARAAQQFEFDEEAELYRQLDLSSTEFCGYEVTEAEAEIVALLSNGEVRSEVSEGESVQVVLNITPFYAESGGQVGDTGVLTSDQGHIKVTDTRHPLANLTVHYGRVTHGRAQVGDSVHAEVDVERRLDIARNHTATHLLHQALQEVLGQHARQSGSLVAPDRLRFDFTHLSAMTPEEITEVEKQVNERIRADLSLSAQIMGYQEALDQGTTALFGEKYGDTVRQIRIETYSSELCGGTHLEATGQIGFFLILGESSIGSGLRRIEALTGRGAESYAREQRETLQDVAAVIEAKPAQAISKAEALRAQLREQQREIDELRRKLAKQDASELLGQVQQIDGMAVLAAQVDAADMDGLRQMSDFFRERLGSAVVVLGAVIEDKPLLVAAATQDLVAEGINAAELIREVAKVVGGGGGGRPHLAQAGGRDVARLDEALARVPELVAKMADSG